MSSSLNELLLRRFCLEVLEYLTEIRDRVWYWFEVEESIGRLLFGIEEKGQLIHELPIALKIGPKTLSYRILAIAKGTQPSPLWPGSEMRWESGLYPSPTELIGWTSRERDWIYFLRWYARQGGFDHDQGTDDTLDRDWLRAIG